MRDSHAACCTLLLLAASRLFAQSGTAEYSVIELPRQPLQTRDLYSFATDINDAGQIVGLIYSDFNNETAVLWDHGTLISVGGPAGSSDTRASDINELGQVVGYGFSGGTSRPFLWEGGTITLLDRLGASSEAYAINDAGQIVGGSSLIDPTNSFTAVMWSGGAVINLLDTSTSTARHINNRGQIIGSNENGPFLWENGVLSELPGLTSVSDINDRGQILAVSNGRPVIWTYGMMTPLALPPGEWQVATAAINELGHAVGTLLSTAPGAVSMAVLWRNEEVIILPRLAPHRPSVALDLNNRDEVVGWSGVDSTTFTTGFAQKASLWVPQAPPATTSFTGPTSVEPVTETAHPVPIDLGTLGGTYSTSTGINDDGVVVGSSTTAGREQHAFVWRPTTGMVDLGTLGDRSLPGWPLRTSRASAVNNAGQVVGASHMPRVGTTIQDQEGYRAFLWTPSAGMQRLGTLTLSGDYSHATAINDVGQVIGRSGGRAVSWPPTGGGVDLGTLGGRAVQPVAINNLGQVVGTSSLVAGSSAPPFPKHAFLWTASSGMADLGTLGGPSSAAAAMNDSGQVVGWAQTAGASFDVNWRAFLWTATSGMVDLGSLGGTHSVARDVNASGAVVGTSAVADGDPAFHAFVWRPTSGMVDLGTFGGTDSEAYAVSDAGQVVGRSLTPGNAAWHAFAWTAHDGMVDLVPLDGYTDSAAYALNNSGAVVGSSYDRASGTYRATMWVVPVAPPVDDWMLCAPEGGVCAFTGATEVRYGANGSYVYLTLTDGTACTNEVFGDPIYGTVKACAIRGTPPPSEWTVCATEGGACAFTGTMEVRYGVNGAFVYRTLSNGTACTNDVFGDPIYGSVKYCAMRIAPPPTDWTFCAAEGGVCAFTGVREVRYGANGVYVYQTLLDGTACTNSVFGDPVYGTPKQCDTRPAAPPPTNMSSILDNDDGLLAGTDVLNATFAIFGETARLTLELNGPVDLWDPALDPDTGFTQIFLHIDRASVQNTGFHEIGGDFVVSHEEPVQELRVNNSGHGFAYDSSPFFGISGNQYTLSFPVDWFGSISSGEVINWVVITTASQTPKDFNTVAIVGDPDRGRESTPGTGVRGFSPRTVHPCPLTVHLASARHGPDRRAVIHCRRSPPNGGPHGWATAKPPALRYRAR